jgi:hypothetical protein
MELNKRQEARKEEKMDVERTMELNKRYEDMFLLTASTAGMSPWTRVAHNFYKGMIIDDIEAKMAAAEAAAATPPPKAELAPEGASATSSTTTHASAVSASASASSSVSASASADRAVVVLDGPTSTQDVLSASPNPFF